ncbi:MAG TPA: GntR family transcriptional regulator, partial [Pyrinomonadaceae bacterium]
MTMWTPDLSETGGPLSRAIVNALAADIEAGRIEPGTRLPTHRELADRLGVAIGTVTRAYALAKRRGLVSGEVGRGTFVGSGTGASREETSGGAEAPIDLSKNQIARETQDRLLAETLAALSARSDLAPLLEYYQPAEGVSRHRAAGAAWVGRIGLDADPAQTLVCSG